MKRINIRYDATLLREPLNFMFWHQVLVYRSLSWKKAIFLFVAMILFASEPVAAEDPRTVHVGLKVHQITGINQKEENFGVVATLLMKWHEPALISNSGEADDFEMYDASHFVRLLADRKLPWPAMLFYNLQGRIDYQNRTVLVDGSGTVSYLTRFTATFQAPNFDFKHFPFDQQRFVIMLDSVRPLDQIKFTELKGYSQMGDTLGEEEWIIDGTRINLTEHTEIEKRSSRFEFAFDGTRHLNYYLVRIFIPMVIIVLVSWFTFFLKDYNKRIDLANGNLLLFIAFSFTIANDLPRLGYLTLIDTMLLATFVIAGFVVLANVLMRRLHRKERVSLIEKIDSVGIWGYPFVYIVAGLLIYKFFYGSV